MPETITRTVRMDFNTVPRIAFDTPFSWNLYPIGVVGLELVGDNETVVSWASGRARVIGREGGLAERVGGDSKGYLERVETGVNSAARTFRRLV